MNADERVPTAEDTLVPSPRPRRWLQKKGPEEIPGLRHFGLWVSLVVHAPHTTHTTHSTAGHGGRRTFLLRPFGDHGFRGDQQPGN